MENKPKYDRYYNFMATLTLEKAINFGFKNIDELYSFVVSHFDVDNDQIAVMLHDKDLGSEHYHIALHLKNAMNINAVAKRLNIAPNFVEKWDNRVDNLWAYLLHLTDNAKNEKYNYSDYIDDLNHLKTNINLDIFRKYIDFTPKTKSKSNKADAIQLKILSGEITERDLLMPEMLPYYFENMAKCQKALQLRQKSLRINPPKCSCIYISGRSGLGKTTLANKIAKELYGNSIVIASSSNDPLQDYTDEKCFIIDDFRAKNYDFNFMLGLLDPNYRSRTHQSRYYNKVLACEMILITSVDDIDTTINHYADITDEDMRQLRRRIQTIYALNADSTFKNLKYTTYIYNDIIDSYEYVDPQQTFSF